MTDASSTSALVASLTRRLSDIDAFKRALVDKTRQAQAKGGAITAEKALVNPHVAKTAAIEKEVADTRVKIAAAQRELESKRAELTIKAEAVTVFGPKGVRAHILDTVTPYLNDRTAHYLSVLTDGNIRAVWKTLTLTAKGDLRENFSIEVTHLLGGDSFAEISGGEKRKVRLSCAMALQDLVATRASKPIDFWAADEIDQALDNAGLERLMLLLNERVTTRGSVFVISHSDLNSYCPNTITITKSGGVSTIGGATE